MIIREQTNNGFKANPNLINRELAMRSHSGTSWDPEKRGVQEIAEFVSYVQEFYERLNKHARTDQQKQYLLTEMERFQSAFANKYNAKLSSQGSCMSTMIAGPSKFPVRRQQKVCTAADKRYEELIEFRDRAEAAILRELKKMAVEEAGGELEVLKKKIADAIRNHGFMVKTNAIVRKKISDEQKIKEIQALTPISEITVRKILTPDYMGRIGFPAYELSNDTANIHRMEERAKELERKEATPSADIMFEGGSIKDNATEDRVQIFFDQKPQQAMIDKLKGEGWRWAPSVGAWSRKRTDQAMGSAERILGIKITRERFVPEKIDPARALYDAIQRDKGETAGVKTANFISIIQKLDNLPLRQQEVNRAKLLLSSLPNLTLDELIAMEKTVKQWGVTVPQIKDEIDAIYKEYLELRKSEKGQFIQPQIFVPVKEIPKTDDDVHTRIQKVIDIIKIYRDKRATYEDLVVGLKGYYLQQSGYAMGSNLNVQKLTDDLKKSGYNNLGELWTKIIVQAPERKVPAGPPVFRPQPQALKMFIPPKYTPLLYPAQEVKKYTIPRLFEKGTIARDYRTNKIFVLETDVEALQQDKNARIWKTAYGHYIYLDDQRPAPVRQEPDKITDEDTRLLKFYETYSDDAIQKRILQNEGKLKNLAARKLVRIEKGQYGTMGSAYIEQERLGISEENSGLIRVLELRKRMVTAREQINVAERAKEIMIIPNPETMTRDEYIKEKLRRLAQVLRQQGSPHLAARVEHATDLEWISRFAASHRDQVVLALAQGKTVGGNVLKDYPDIVARIRKENEALLAKDKAERDRLLAIENIEKSELIAELNRLPPALKRHAETEIYSTLHMLETHKDYRNRYVIATGIVRRIAFSHLPQKPQPSGIRKEEPVEPMLPEQERVLKAYLEKRGHELTLRDFVWADKYTIRGTVKYPARTMEEKRKRDEFILKNYDEETGKKYHRGTVESALSRGLKVQDEVLKEYPDLMKKEVPEPTGYFTLRKAQDLIRENNLKLSDAKLHEKSIQLRDYIQFIESPDEYSRRTLVKGGYYAGVIHPDVTGMVPVDMWLHQNLKTTLDEVYKEQQRRKQEKEKVSVPIVPVAKPGPRIYVQKTFTVEERMRRYGYA